MRSIALYIHRTGLHKSRKVKPIEEELHLNIWKVQQGHFRLKPKLYIDFGFMTTFDVDKICLYLPFQIVGNPKDIGGKLQNSREMLCSVFNEEFLSETQPNICYSSVKKPFSSNVEFYLFQLGKDNVEVISHNEEEVQGTYIFITPSGIFDNRTKKKRVLDKKYYIRLRIEVKNIKDIVRSEFVSNDLFQAAFSKTDLYDIRINETREIHPKIKEKMNRQRFNLCLFKKIHLFYMADTKEKIENEGSLKSDSRILEEGKWINYEPKSDLYNIVFLAHHWKKSMKDNEPISSFSLFFSTIYPHIHWCHLTAFLSVIIFSSWSSSMLVPSGSLVNPNFGNLLRIVLVSIIFLYILVYIVFSNFGVKNRIYRKR